MGYLLLLTIVPNFQESFCKRKIVSNGAIPSIGILMLTCSILYRMEEHFTIGKYSYTTRRRKWRGNGDKTSCHDFLPSGSIICLHVV